MRSYILPALLVIMILPRCFLDSRDSGDNGSPPVVTAMADTTVQINDSLTLTATAVDNGTVVKYLWARDGTVYADTTAAGSLTVAYADSGRQVVRVIAIDDDGEASAPDSCVVTVTARAPELTAVGLEVSWQEDGDTVAPRGIRSIRLVITLPDSTIADTFTLAECDSLSWDIEDGTPIAVTVEGMDSAGEVLYRGQAGPDTVSGAEYPVEISAVWADSCRSLTASSLELVYPGGGETFTLGQAVTVRLKLDKNRIASVVIKISIDGGLTYKNVLIGSAVTPDAGGARYQCKTYTWTVGSEGETVGYAAGNTDCILRIEDYQDSQIHDVSGTFTVAGMGGISAAGDLRLTTEVSNWSEESGSYREYDVEGLYDLINGGAVPHEINGLVEGVYQKLTGPSGRVVEIFVEDFGSATNASAMFTYSATNSVSQKVTFTGFSEATAVGTPVLGGVTVFTHFGKFYFNLQFMGYPDNQVAATDASAFLKTYQDKLE